MSAPTTDHPDAFPVSIAVATAVELLRAVAVRAINTHVNGTGACVACGAGWPCSPAVLAERNLAAL